jgi:uncharacterized membrane protein YbhN (UPF0104 family)
LLSVSFLLLTVGAAAVVWPAVQPSLEEATRVGRRANPRLLLLAGLLFAAAPACCGLLWQQVIGQAGGHLSRIDACARYGVGSLLNSVVPAHLGDVVRTGLLLQALPLGGRRRIVRCFGAVQGVRLATLAGLVLAASLPAEPEPYALLVPFLVALWLLGRKAQLLLAFSLLAAAAKVAAAAAVLAALDAPSPLRNAFIVVPALELAALVPLTPGNVGVASVAAAVALHGQGLDLSEAVPAGIILHAVETAARVFYGTGSALLCLVRLRKRRLAARPQRLESWRQRVYRGWAISSA